MQSQLSRNVLRMKTVNYQNVNFYSVLSANRFSNQDFSHEPNLHRKEFPNNSTHLLIKDVSRIKNLLQHRSLNISAVRFSDVVAASSIAAASETGSTASAEAVTATFIAASETGFTASAEAVTATSIAASETGFTASAEAVTAVSSSDASKELLLDFLPEKPTPIDPTAILGKNIVFIPSEIFNTYISHQFLITK